MKTLSVILLGLSLGTPALAQFYPVKAKSCNGKQVPVGNGERVFVDLNAGAIGIGYTDQNCKVVDFSSVTITEQSTEQAVVEVVSQIGRRTTCSSGVLPYAGPVYLQAVVLPNGIELKDVAGECSNIAYSY